MSYDNACKYLAETHPVDFVRWLLSVEPTDIQILKTELSIEPIRADSVSFLSFANEILHLEFETDPYSEPPISLRMLDYSVRLKRKYRCDVEQVVIFLREIDSDLVFLEEYRDRTTRHQYRVIRLWQEDSAPFLANSGLLPLATLTRTSSPEALLEQVAQQVARIEDIDERRNLAGCTEILAGLRFEKNLIRQLFREEVMRESVIYQEIIQQGRREGLQQGLQQGELNVIMRQLRRRLGELEPVLNEQIRGLTTEQLEALADVVLDFSQTADLVTWLEQHG